jgi:hypothetical protein
MIWETGIKIQLLEVELKRLAVLLDIVKKGDFEWDPKTCPVCLKAKEFMNDAGLTDVFRCRMCASMGISARCHSIDAARCRRKADNNQLTDEDIAFFVHLFIKYMGNTEKEIRKLRQYMIEVDNYAI